jgi:hypothetical protein
MTQAPPFIPPSTDQRLIYSGITWQQFKLIQAGFAESPGIRLAYYDSTIEILMPGRDREIFSRLIGFLIVLFCLENAIEIARSEIPELATLSIDLLSHCVLMAQTSRLEAAREFRKALKSPSV